MKKDQSEVPSFCVPGENTDLQSVYCSKSLLAIFLSALLYTIVTKYYVHLLFLRGGVPVEPEVTK